jgi:hypothetical protein
LTPRYALPVSGWTTRASIASFVALAVALLAVLLLHPDGDGTEGWVLGVTVDTALICFATSLFAAFLSRR